jgi:hypothetical protein
VRGYAAGHAWTLTRTHLAIGLARGKQVYSSLRSVTGTGPFASPVKRLGVRRDGSGPGRAVQPPCFAESA